MKVRFAGLRSSRENRAVIHQSVTSPSNIPAIPVGATPCSMPRRGRQPLNQREYPFTFASNPADCTQAARYPHVSFRLNSLKWVCGINLSC